MRSAAIPSRALAAALAIAAMPSGAAAQRVPTLPGAWPLTGAPPAASAAPLPLPDRGIEFERTDRPTGSGGVDVSAGYLFEGRDPTLHEAEPIGPSHRELPRGARDQPPAVPGVTVTVPLR